LFRIDSIADENAAVKRTNYELFAGGGKQQKTGPIAPAHYPSAQFSPASKSILGRFDFVNFRVLSPISALLPKEVAKPTPLTSIHCRASRFPSGGQRGGGDNDRPPAALHLS
jgi:hypothetical protein